MTQYKRYQRLSFWQRHRLLITDTLGLLFVLAAIYAFILFCYAVSGVTPAGNP